MNECTEIFSTVYSQHPLGRGVSGDNGVNIRHDFGNLVSIRVSGYWVLTTSKEFEKFFISEENKKRFVFEIETNILKNTNKSKIVWLSVWRNLKFQFYNSQKCAGLPTNFNSVNPVRSRKLDRSYFGTGMCSLLDEWSDWYNYSGFFPQWMNCLYVSETKIFFLVRMNQTDQWINSIKLKSLDKILYFSVLQEMFENTQKKSVYMRRIFFISFLSHYGFTKTIENEIDTPCHNVFGCYDLQRHIGSFL